MNDRVYSFSAGPAVLPEPVLEQAREEMLSFRGTGTSVMEISHRSDEFQGVLDEAEVGIRGLLNVPDHYSILFLQGGASLQFSMVPINFLPHDRSADYVVTGTWSKKAVAEAQKCGVINVICSTEASGFTIVPSQRELDPSANAVYLHYASNETIHGVEFNYDLDGHGIPVVCDASSDILSRPIDIDRYAMIYAGAQKNIGPSGVTLVIIRNDLLDLVPQGLPSTLDYRKIAENRSMYNTPNTWGIYIVSLVCKWLTEQGGVAAISRRNSDKASTLYDAIDSSDGFYTGHAARSARSRMNVTFRLPSPELDATFCEEARVAGFVGLKGHRSLGGIRASIYNAFPVEGTVALASFMQEFAGRHG
jgi:phosphoserine aminotransferase